MAHHEVCNLVGSACMQSTDQAITGHAFDDTGQRIVMSMFRPCRHVQRLSRSQQERLIEPIEVSLTNLASPSTHLFPACCGFP